MASGKHMAPAGFQFLHSVWLNRIRGNTAEATCLKVLKSLNNLSFGRHDEWSVLEYGLAQWDATNQEYLEIG
jgi:hypothetical protein